MDEDELQDDQLEGGQTPEGDASGSDNSAPPSETPAPQADSKRVDDLMSKWQSEQARANRLQKELDAARAGGGSQGAPQGDADGSMDEFREFARENARNQLFGSDPKLAAYGLKAEDITGSTIAEMRESLRKHQKLIDGVETQARNQILAEHGLSPEVATGASTENAPKFSQMSDEEFDKFLKERDGSYGF